MGIGYWCSYWLCYWISFKWKKVNDIGDDLSNMADKFKSKVSETIDKSKEVEKIGVNEHPKAYPTEILSIINEPGAELRTTLIEFGPVLFSKILALNNTQSDNVSLEFIGSGSKRGKKYSS